jgi:hypothetical protein
MATITISDLHVSGSELFSDSESYMNELGDGELQMINGEGTPLAISASVIVTLVASAHVAMSIAATRRLFG